MTAQDGGANEEACSHAPYGPLDLDCADCRRRGQARVRKQRSRGKGSGPASPVPRLGGVTRQQVLEVWKAAAETRAVVEELEDCIERLRRQSREPSQALLTACESLRGNLIVLEGLGDVYRKNAGNVYPPLPRS